MKMWPAFVKTEAEFDGAWICGHKCTGGLRDSHSERLIEQSRMGKTSCVFLGAGYKPNSLELF